MSKQDPKFTPLFKGSWADGSRGSHYCLELSFNFFGHHKLNTNLIKNVKYCIINAQKCRNEDQNYWKCFRSNCNLTKLTTIVQSLWTKISKFACLPSVLPSSLPSFLTTLGGKHYAELRSRRPVLWGSPVSQRPLSVPGKGRPLCVLSRSISAHWGGICSAASLSTENRTCNKSLSQKSFSF